MKFELHELMEAIIENLKYNYEVRKQFNGADGEFVCWFDTQTNLMPLDEIMIDGKVVEVKRIIYRDNAPDIAFVDEEDFE